jgi:hypothetical protein
MMTMMRGPPQRTALHGRSAEQREHELRGARRLERAMREVAMIEGGDREHAQRIEPDGRRDGHAARAHPPHGDARDVQADERHHAQPVDALGLVGAHSR